MDVGRKKIISGKMELQRGTPNQNVQLSPSPAPIPTYINTNPLCDGNYSNIFHSCVPTSVPFIGCNFYIASAM